MSFAPLTLDRDGSGVVTLTLRPIPEGGAVVVLNGALIRAIDAALDEVARGPAPGGFVLASESRVFIAGADLKEIMGLSDAELHAYLRLGQRVYGRIAALACTSVAAINGAALGGGLEIAMHCDHLLAAEPAPGTPDKPSRPYPIGLPEAGLSICPGWGGTNLLPARMDPARAIELTATGKVMNVLEGRDAGLIEALHPPGELLERARARARAPRVSGGGSSPRAARSISDGGIAPVVRAALSIVGPKLAGALAADAVLDCVRVGLERGWSAALDAEREHLVRLRGTPQGKAAIEGFFAKK